MRTIARPLASLALVTLTNSGWAQNAVQNSTFEATLVPWEGIASAAPDPVATGTAVWTNARNLDNMPTGSGASDTTLAADVQGANAWFGIRQCVVLPSAPVAITEASYEGGFLAPATGNPSDGLANVTVEIRFFSDTTCTTFVSGAGGSQGADLTPALLSDTQWYTIGDPQFLPPGASITASSAEVKAYVRTVGTTSNAYRLYFDQIILSVNTPVDVDLVFKNGFEVPRRHWEIE